jgi:hypothetical protein
MEVGRAKTVTRVKKLSLEGEAWELWGGREGFFGKGREVELGGGAGALIIRRLQLFKPRNIIIPAGQRKEKKNRGFCYGGS